MALVPLPHSDGYARYMREQYGIVHIWEILDDEGSVLRDGAGAGPGCLPPEEKGHERAVDAGPLRRIWKLCMNWKKTWKAIEMILTITIFAGLIIDAVALGRLKTIEAVYCGMPGHQKELCR
jgi:hypothetical protein